MKSSAFNKNAHHTPDFLKHCKPNSSNDSPGLCGDQTDVQCSNHPCCYGLTNGEIDRNKSVPCYSYSKHNSHQKHNNYSHNDHPTCTTLVSQNGCDQLLTNGKTLGEACPHECGKTSPKTDKLRNCSELVSQYGCNQPLTDGTTTGESCPRSCANSSQPTSKKQCRANPNCSMLGLTGNCCPTDAGVTLDCCKEQNPSHSSNPNCTIDPCSNPEQYLTKEVYPINVTQSLRVTIPFAQASHQIPFLGESSVVDGKLPHRNSAECIYQIILWWFNYEKYTCTNGDKGRLGSKLAQLLALLTVGIIPLSCIDKDPPMLAKKAWVIRMTELANEIETNYIPSLAANTLKDPGFDMEEHASTYLKKLSQLPEDDVDSAFTYAQSLFYTVIESTSTIAQDENRIIPPKQVEVYSSANSATTAMIDVTNWNEKNKTAAYNALVCLLAIIRPPLAWCPGVNCDKPSKSTLESWMNGTCLPTNSNMCEMLDDWKNNYSILGSNWYLASQLLISESQPDFFLIQESRCVRQDALRVKNAGSYYNCKSVSNIDNYNQASTTGIKDLLNTINKISGVSSMRSDDPPESTTPKESDKSSTNMGTDESDSNDNPQADAQVTVSTPKESSGFNWSLFGAITGIVVLLIVLIIGFVFLKKKADRSNR